VTEWTTAGQPERKAAGRMITVAELSEALDWMKAPAHAVNGGATENVANCAGRPAVIASPDSSIAARPRSRIRNVTSSVAPGVSRPVTDDGDVGSHPNWRPMLMHSTYATGWPFG